MTNVRKNKKGFTLIELIIVIAILAILVALLAPNLIKYIEKSRVGKDINTIDGVYTTVKAALMGDEATAKLSSEGEWVPLSDILDSNDAADTYYLLYVELFGEDGSGSLDAKYGEDTANSVLKSKAAEGSAIAVMFEDGKVYAAAINTDEDGVAAVVTYGNQTIAAGDETLAA